MAGPLGSEKWNDNSRPSHTDRHPSSAATPIRTGKRRLQNRDAAEGNIIRPTTISAPIAWKPMPRFNKTRDRNKPRAKGHNRLTVARKRETQTDRAKGRGREGTNEE